MKLVNILTGSPSFGPCVIGFGTFDGVHRGHQALIAAIRQKAADISCPSAVFTFDHSPRRILEPRNFHGEITTPEEKFSLLSASGVDWVVFRPFDAEFAAVSPEEFVREIVIKKLQARVVYVGFNFGFGQQRRGNAQYLGEILRQSGVECHILEPVEHEGQTISSSVIRGLIHDGSFELANRLLGREAAFCGTVIHGDHRGREMGFPTANLDLAQTFKVLPPRGVYFCLVDTPKGTFPALVNIGIRPTFNKTQPLLEAHLLDFQGDIYHQTIRVRFVQRIRGEERFPTMADLVRQIQSDLEQARTLVKTLQRTTG
jgi:riboflavin kinase/FMN adenylyltransferase